MKSIKLMHWSGYMLSQFHIAYSSFNVLPSFRFIPVPFISLHCAACSSITLRELNSWRLAFSSVTLPLNHPISFQSPNWIEMDWFRWHRSFRPHFHSISLSIQFQRVEWVWNEEREWLHSPSFRLIRLHCAYRFRFTEPFGTCALSPPSLSLTSIHYVHSFTPFL